MKGENSELRPDQAIDNEPIGLDSQVAIGPNGATDESLELRGDPWRFVVTIIFCFLSISNAMQWLTFAAVVDEVRAYFNMTAVQVNYLATVYVIVYVSAIFLSCKLFEVTGIKISIVVAALANAIGAALKIIALYFWPHMALLYIAQIFNSITEILTIATPPLISNRWFPENERMVANTILSGALNFGCAIGALIPTFFVTPEMQSQRHFGNLFWFQFGICGVLLPLSIFFIPARPRYRVSFASARQQRSEEKRLLALGKVRFLRLENSQKSAHGEGDESHEKDQQEGESKIKNNNNNNNNNNKKEGNITVDNGTQTRPRPADDDDDDENEPEVQPINVFSTVMDVLRMMRKNLSLDFLMIASAAEIGLIWAIATVLPQCLSPFGVTGVESGWISFLNLFLGTIVAPFVLPFLTKRFEYKTLLVAIGIILIVNLSALTLCLKYGPPVDGNRSYYVILTFVLWGGVAGLCQNFLLPLMFEFVVELTFPMPESTSAPVLTWSACLTNLILAIVFGEVLGDDPSQSDALRVFIASTAVCFIGGVSLFLIRPLSRRKDYEDTMKSRQDTRLMQQVEGPVDANSGLNATNKEERAPVNVNAAERVVVR